MVQLVLLLAAQHRRLVPLIRLIELRPACSLDDGDGDGCLDELIARLSHRSLRYCLALCFQQFLLQLLPLQAWLELTSLVLLR